MPATRIVVARSGASVVKGRPEVNLNGWTTVISGPFTLASSDVTSLHRKPMRTLPWSFA
jgi:hypothetical protein